MKPENFQDEAQAIAAKLRTAYGYVRPAKRRCSTLGYLTFDLLLGPRCNSKHIKHCINSSAMRAFTGNSCTHIDLDQRDYTSSRKGHQMKPGGN